MARKGYRAAEFDRFLLTEASRVDDELRSIEKEEAPPGVVDDQHSVKEGVVLIAAGERPTGVGNSPARDGGGGRHLLLPGELSRRFRVAAKGKVRPRALPSGVAARWAAVSGAARWAAALGSAWMYTARGR
jgi:hypothetical protein